MEIMRCAIYARYSSDLQRESSIEDQIRKCRTFASQQGWTVLEEFVRFDQAISGASLASRNALLSLLEDAKKDPLPYDRLLVDDTSRLARNIEDALHLSDILRFNGVGVTAISQGIDSQQKSARSLLALHGIIDEQYLTGLAEKVHRGQEGRVLKGLHPGGRCYGYRNVPIEDPTRPAKYGRPAVTGVLLEIDQEQASIVRRIFREYAEGFSLAAIAKRLNADGILSPQPSQAQRERSWSVSSLYEILRRDRYRGVFVWNRTKKERNPETGRKVSRPRPLSEWQTVLVPNWRIVSDQLWGSA
jgi:DNA invertase Pin-like site-specific DNA recombinase